MPCWRSLILSLCTVKIVSLAVLTITNTITMHSEMFHLTIITSIMQDELLTALCVVLTIFGAVATHIKGTDYTTGRFDDHSLVLPLTCAASCWLADVLQTNVKYHHPPQSGTCPIMVAVSSTIKQRVQPGAGHPAELTSIRCVAWDVN